MLRARPSAARRSLAAPCVPRQWLLLALQLPATPSNARVKTWRRLQQIGAIALKGSLYVLPSSAQALEDFEWLRTEIRSAKGQASIFEATSPHGLEDAEIVELFRKARRVDYQQISKDTKKVRAIAARVVQRPEAAKALRLIQERIGKLQAIDFFPTPDREGAEHEVQALEAMLRRSTAASEQPKAELADVHAYQHRVWVTRPRPGVDRMASAWLISRLIDRHARFAFTSDPKDIPEGVPFDMYGEGFGHNGAMCTFEVLQHSFGVKDVAVRHVGEIVHDIDLKEEHFRRQQAAGVAAMVDGLQKAFNNDDELLKQGVVMFDAIYRGLQDAVESTTAKRSRRLRKAGGPK